MKNIKASILIANYNNQKYISACLKSLFNQNFKNFEIIFHDDFSSDDSITEVKKFKNVKIIANKKRGKHGSLNQIDAYQRAFKYSKGEIIFLLDSDDYFSHTKVKEVIKIFDRYKEIKVAYDLPIVLNNKIKKKIYNKKKIIKNFWPYVPNQSCISIRSKNFNEIINKIKIKKFYDIWMDFRISIYAIYIEKKFFIIEKNLTYYRKTESAVSTKFKFLSINWWFRRMEAHNYVKFFFNKNKIFYKKNFDYYLTKFVTFFLIK